jgi:hypothetical protein
MASPGVAGGAGVGGGAAAGVDQPDLPLVAAVVGGDQALQRLRSRQALAHECDAVGSVRHVGIGLGGDRAGARICPRHHRADGEELRGDGCAEIAGLQVHADDGKGGDDRVDGLRAHVSLGQILRT